LLRHSETLVPNPNSSRLLPAIYGALHALVDAATVTVVFRACRLHDLDPSAAFALVVAYDVIAFGSQSVFGWITDRLCRPRQATMLGLSLTAACIGLLPISPYAAMACAGVGNSLFHLGAGASVLNLGLDRSSSAGIFVAPGVLGLGFGLYYGKNPSLGPVWPMAILLMLGFAIAAWILRDPETPRRVPSTTTPGLPNGSLILLLLLGSIAIRSLVGMSASRGVPKSEWLLPGITLAAFAGKFIGGILADRYGWIVVTVGALILSAPWIAMGRQSLPSLLLGLLLFQMTMPVTLVAVARVMPRYPATAFGLTCLALLVGALPTMFPLGLAICSSTMLPVWIAVSAVFLYAGLRHIAVDQISSVRAAFAQIGGNS
jgi:FSR family fosmidomycin resistance protein-like MFS transporter